MWCEARDDANRERVSDVREHRHDDADAEPEPGVAHDAADVDRVRMNPVGDDRHRNDDDDREWTQHAVDVPPVLKGRERERPRENERRADDETPALEARSIRGSHRRHGTRRSMPHRRRRASDYFAASRRRSWHASYDRAVPSTATVRRPV